MSYLRFVLHLARWRQWPARRKCHHGIACCQYVDRPNCNNGRFRCR